MAIVIGERGWFFVNDVFVAEVGLRDMTHAGDVAVITGAYIGDVVAGAVTRYENFTGRQLTRQYGPAEGILEYTDEGKLGEHWSGVWPADLIIEAEFVNPGGTYWNYGFAIRNPEFNNLELIMFTDESRWYHFTRETGDDTYAELSSGHLAGSARTGDRNRMLLIANEDKGWLFFNGQLVARLELGHNQNLGDTSLVGDNRTSEVEFRDFKVWAP